MGSNLNKERVLFLIATALFVWVMIKLGLYWTHDVRAPGAPKVKTPNIERGDPNIRDLLAMASLDHYTGRGARNPFFADDTQPSAFFVRSTVHHTFGTAVIRSRYAFQCRMTPNPVREVRFRIPENTVIRGVHSDQIDPARAHGPHGRTYVVPVRPTPLKRTFYQCTVELLTATALKLPTTWTAPNISCTGAMRKVDSESGILALVVPGDRVLLIPAAAAVRNPTLEPLAEAAWPNDLTGRSTKLVYRFPLPKYDLALKLQRNVTVAVRKPEPPNRRKPGPVIKKPVPVIKKPAPVIDGHEPVIEGPGDEEPGLDIPGRPSADKPPLKVMVFLEHEAPEPRRQVVLRHTDSGEYYRAFEGDTILDGLVIAKISNNAVIIVDPKKKKRFIFRGRFEDEYNE